MKNLNATEKQVIESLVELFRSGESVTNSIMEVHDFIVYGLDADLFNSNIQNGVYTIKQIVEAIKPLEDQFKLDFQGVNLQNLPNLQKAIELYPDAMDSFAEQYLAGKNKRE